MMTENFVNYNETEKAILNMVSDKLMWGRDKVDHNSSFVDDLAADSLDIVELIMAFEELFDCEVSDEDAEKILCVKDLFYYCERYSLLV